MRPQLQACAHLQALSAAGQLPLLVCLQGDGSGPPTEDGLGVAPCLVGWCCGFAADGETFEFFKTALPVLIVAGHPVDQLVWCAAVWKNRKGPGAFCGPISPPKARGGPRGLTSSWPPCNAANVTGMEPAGACLATRLARSNARRNTCGLSAASRSAGPPEQREFQGWHRP